MIALKENNRLRKERSTRYPAEHFRPAGPGAGFTLIEVLLALAIFSIGLIAVAGMQMSSVTRNTSSRLNTIAVEYAAEYMERLLGLGMDSNVQDDLLDNNGDGQIDERGEVLDYPHLLAGGPYRPADFVGTDYDNDGRDDIPVNQEFDTIFDLFWTVVEEDSSADDFMAVPPATLSPVRHITMTVRWANGHKEIVLQSLKSTAL